MPCERASLLELRRRGEACEARRRHAAHPLARGELSLRNSALAQSMRDDLVGVLLDARVGRGREGTNRGVEHYHWWMCVCVADGASWMQRPTVYMALAEYK